ncbi:MULTISPECIES: sensor histidine kinase [unclassified Streptomyces]|uniref:sensor histidine kinase n=1 Tax=unclassified Streptomyces TaxID=2593676 RepID=UPI00081DE0A4|nr:MULTISPECIES: sensor histidine kinase [unclassified Streptomyces]MYZ34074.1 GHKL domain-containing protein [Streptomyces sp. SID4917]SCF63920.1 two-component system, CitB family, sensor kinase [Streptomyces sp. MnatMP-M17]
MSAGPGTTERRRRFGWPRRVFSQVLLMQLAIAAGVTVLATGLFLAPFSKELDDQAMSRALAIAETTASAEVADDLLASRPTPGGPVQAEADRIRRATGAEYVVIMDRRGIRWSHTDIGQIGKVVSTDPSAALAGAHIREIDSGTLGRSARGKVPLRDRTGTIVGAVSVGIAYDSVRDRLLAAIPGLLAYAGGALAAGALAAYLISRRLQRQTHDLAFSDISALLTEREAMLHSLREGVVALNGSGRIRLINDEAQRLLGLGPDAIGRPLDEVLGAGRTTEVLTGRVLGVDLLAVRGSRVLVANRMPTDDGGAVVTLRDRTELEQLGRELDATRGLIDALRAQDHEHANRMHTLLGLLELDMHEEAVEFVNEVVGVHRATAEQITERIHDPLPAALLVGKATVAAERGVSLRLSSRTLLPDRLVDPQGLVTVVGNLVDNALDAAAGSEDPRIEVELRAEGRTVVLVISDSGPGVPAAHRELVFSEGWSTKELPAHGKRGLGLALVRRLAERQGGSARVGESAQGGAEFTVVLPEALTAEAEADDAEDGAGDPMSAAGETQ